MFRGSIPSQVQNWIGKTVQTWPEGKDVWVGCSGNLTVERVLHAVRPDLRSHGNDITIYSCALGTYAAGGDLGFQLKPQVAEAYPWMQKSMEGDAADRLAVMFQATRFAPAVLHVGEFRRRQMEGFRRQWDDIHGRTAQKLRGLTLRLASFTPGDVIDWMGTIPPDHAVAMYPPFFGASTAFQSDTADLEAMFDWPDPGFTELTPERMAWLFDHIADREHWAFGVNKRLDGWDQHLRGFARTTNRGVPIYLYSSEEHRMVTVPRQVTRTIANKRIAPGDTIGDRMTLAVLDDGQFAQIRSQYMNHGIRPGQPGLSVAVLVDDVIIGAYAIKQEVVGGHAGASGSVHDPHVAYLLSDFPVAPSSYPRLSKLVLYAALSVESQMLLRRLTPRVMTSMMTTAFSRNPVSMKYRGLFRLHTRKPLELDKQHWATDIDPRDSYYGQKWMLNYVSDLGRWTLDEGLAEWKARHGKTGKGGSGE